MPIHFFDPFFRRSLSRNVCCFGPCNSNPAFRGLGFYPYVLNEMCLYLHEIGIEKALISTASDNHASLRGINKANFHQFSSGTRIKLGPLNFWLHR